VTAPRYKNRVRPGLLLHHRGDGGNELVEEKKNAGGHAHGMGGIEWKA